MTTTHDPSTCDVCPDHLGEGWKIQDVTHCRECGATWRLGTNANHCKKCHLTFSTLKAGYDLHSDHSHQHPSKAGLVPQVNRWGTEEWGTQEGWDQRAALAEKMSKVD
jgi:ribosomal protein L40E